MFGWNIKKPIKSESRSLKKLTKDALDRYYDENRHQKSQYVRDMTEMKTFGSELKPCINCNHVIRINHQYVLKDYRCKRDGFTYCPVTGEKLTDELPLCGLERSDSDCCGKEGKFYEVK